MLSTIATPKEAVSEGEAPSINPIFIGVFAFLSTLFPYFDYLIIPIESQQREVYAK